MFLIIVVIIIAYAYYKDKENKEIRKEKEEKEEKKQYLKEFKTEQKKKAEAFEEKLSVECNDLKGNLYIASVISVPAYIIRRHSDGKMGKTTKGIESIRLNFSINLIDQYLYIIPSEFKKLLYNGFDTSGIYSIDDILKKYRNEFNPNYKDLFLKIKLEDIKFYTQTGQTYTDINGNITSKRDWDSLILMGDNEYKVSGDISTTLRDSRETEFYYNDNGEIKKLIFTKDSITQLALLIPDKEKK